MEPRSESRTSGARRAPGSGASGNGTRDEVPFSEALRSAVELLGETAEYARYLVTARIDSLKASAMKAAFLAASGAVAGIAAFALIAAAAVLAIRGLAGGLGALFGGIPWLGDLVAGVLVLAGAGIALAVAWKILRRKSLRKVRRKYEERLGRERARFGRSVADQAARAAADEAAGKAESARRAAADAAERAEGRL